MASGEPTAAEVLEGVLERVTFVNEENGWSVVKLAVPRRQELVTVVGHLPGAQPGESLRLSGRWIHDRKYGEQFEARTCTTVKPSTLVGIEKYLGSGLVRGLGKVIAGRLVAHFGLESLEIIDLHPERLTEVEGIGPVRQRRITTAWAEQRHIQEVMVFLQAHGVTPAFAVRIFKAYRDRAIQLVKEDPYRLALDIWGIGFKTADRIAEALGIPRDSPQRAAAGLLHTLNEGTDEGHVFLPRERLLETATELLSIDRGILEPCVAALAAARHVVVASGEDAPVYLASLHAAETGSAELVAALASAPPTPISLDVERAIAWFEGEQRLTLAEEQREAIRRAVSAKVLVITGGPGTGKTTLVNGVIRILEKKGRRIVLAAPTGRAAKRMTEATGREAKTLHRLLEIDPRSMTFQRNRERPLEADVLIVDEASMLDAVLTFNLLKAVPPRCQLLLVGDVDQLPSVGPGSVLRELIDSATVEVVRLTRIFRQAQASQIIVSAHRVNEGQLPAIDAPAETSDFFFIERDEPEAIVTTVKRLVAERIPRKLGVLPADVQVLTPMHRGLLGAASLNAELQATLNPSGPALVRGTRLLRLGDRVMQLRNNYELEVFNGDIGRVEAVDEEERSLSVRCDERLVTYEQAELDELTLAYACSIHKSQGSEYPCVVIPLHTQHYVMLQRNLLYTAITRGKRLVVVVGSRRALAIAVKNQQVASRYTRFGELLRARLMPSGAGRLGPPS